MTDSDCLTPLEVDGVEVPEAEPPPAGGALALAPGETGDETGPAEHVATHRGDQLTPPLDG